MLRAPVPDRRQHGDEINAAVSETVNGLLLVRWVIGAGEDPGIDQSVEPVGQDAAGDSLVRPAQELAKVPPTREDDVPQDQQRPPVSDSSWRG